MRFATAIIAVSILVALTAAGEAREATGGLRDVTAIQDGRGAARVLFRLQEDMQTLSGVHIWKATLRVPLSGASADRVLRLLIYPVTRVYARGSVTWTSGWTRPGADFDDEVFSHQELDLRTAPTEMVFDVTRLLKETLEHRMQADGFILTADPRTALGVPAADLERFGSLAGATLDVKYRKSLRASP